MPLIVSRAVRRQRILLALCALAAILIAIAFWMTIDVAGAGGANFDPTAIPFVLRATSIEPGSAEDAAGIRAGDTLDVRDVSPSVRVRLDNGPHCGGHRPPKRRSRGRPDRRVTFVISKP
jgi:hypothetical protein